MRDIFKKASRVLMWFGEQDQHTEQIRTAQRNILPNPTRGGSPRHTKNTVVYDNQIELTPPPVKPFRWGLLFLGMQ
jgi:hypothetical protein